MKKYSDRFFRIVSMRDIWVLSSGLDKARILFLSAIFDFFETSCKILGPIALAKTVEMVSQEESDGSVLWIELSTKNMLLASVGFGFVALIAPELRSLTLHGISDGAVNKLVNGLIIKSHKLAVDVPKTQISDQVLRPTQRHLYSVNNNVPILFANVNGVLQPLFFDILIGTVITFFRFEPAVGAVLLLYIAMAILVNELLSYFFALADKKNNASSAFTGFVQAHFNSLNCAETVYLFDRESLEVAIANKLYSRYEKLQSKANIFEKLSNLQIAFVSVMQLVGALYVTRHGFHDLALDDIIFLISYSLSIGKNVNSINCSFKSAIEITKTIDDVLNFLGCDSISDVEHYNYRNFKVAVEFNDRLRLLNPKRSLKTGAPSYQFLNHEKIAIEFVNVWYFGDSNKVILKNVNFKIPANRKTAFVGPSNIGKSTIIKLICGLIKPSNADAKIKIFGRNIESIPASELVKLVGVSKQQVEIFKDESPSYNVLYGFATNKELLSLHSTRKTRKELLPRSSTYEKLNKVMSAACLKEETIARPNSCELSGGEGQRIGIARVLGREQSELEIMIFDEPTSQLDPENETNVQKNIDEALSGKTSIIIAHKLSTIRNADLILVMGKTVDSDGASVIESGTHTELLEKDGEYAKFWYIQTGQPADKVLCGLLELLLDCDLLQRQPAKDFGKKLSELAFNHGLKILRQSEPDSFFNLVKQQLRLNRFPSVLYADLYMQVAEYILKHKVEFAGIMKILANRETVYNYGIHCDLVKALSQALKVNIVIIQIGKKDVDIYSTENPKLTLMLGYDGIGSYQALSLELSREPSKKIKDCLYTARSLDNNSNQYTDASLIKAYGICKLKSQRSLESENKEHVLNPFMINFV